MTVEDEIKNLENLLQSYKKSLQFAIDTGSKQRISNYKSRITQTNNRLDELGKKLPLESNKYLRDEIGKLYKQIKELGEANKKLQTELKEQNDKINKLLNPESIKKEIEEAAIEAGEEMLICPRCGRSIRAKGMKTHQTRWCKKAK